MSIPILLCFVNYSMNFPYFLRVWIEWTYSHKDRILVLVGFLLVATVAFESGFLRGKMSSSPPLVISIPKSSNEEEGKQTLTSPGTEVISQEMKKNESCSFVGSRNSNKYHKTTCAVAKRIKEENKICFTSAEDAEKRGYSAGCLK